MQTGIDLSAFQPTIDWPTVAASGAIGFVYVKATQGTTYTSETFAAQHDGAKAHGMAVGCYHFFDFAVDGTEQAHYFLAQTDGRLGTLLPMVDVEVTSGVQDLEAMIASLADFNAVVEAAVGKRILVYTDMGFWMGDVNASGERIGMGGTDAFIGHPLWVASFGRQPGNPYSMGPWKQWVVHQYTSGGTVPGIAGAVDMDAIRDISAIVRGGG